MAEIIDASYSFGRCRYRFGLKDIKEKTYIIIKNLDYDVIVAVTNYARFEGKYIGSKFRPRKSHPTKANLYYIISALNYIFFDQYTKFYCDDLLDITVDMINAFYDHYNKDLTVNGNLRQQGSIDKCILAVSSFFANFACEYPESRIDKDGLMYLHLIDSKGQAKHRPIYSCKSMVPTKKIQYRNLPLQILIKLIETAYKYTPDIVLALVAGYSAGLRPAESMCLTSDSSTIFTTIECGKVDDVLLKINRKSVHASDGKIVNVGTPKKEREQQVYPPLLNLFISAYDHQLKYLSDHKNENSGNALFVNRWGRPMTYKTYNQRFCELIQVVSRELLSSSVPYEQKYGQILLINNISPHILRHCFTVQLFSDEQNLGVIQGLRGDRDPKSCLWYLSHKTDLTNTFNKVVDDLAQNFLVIGEDIIDGK